MRTAVKATLGETAMIYASLSVCLRDSAAMPCTFGTQLNVFSRESSAFLSTRKHLWYLLGFIITVSRRNVNPFIICPCVGRGLGPAEKYQVTAVIGRPQRGRGNLLGNLSRDMTQEIAPQGYFLALLAMSQNLVSIQNAACWGLRQAETLPLGEGDRASARSDEG